MASAQERQLGNSRNRPVTKGDVIAEYRATAGKSLEHEKAKWGSEASMTARYRLGLSIIDWRHVRRWLDVGCGTGLFFALAEAEGLRFDDLCGADITKEMIEQARRRSYASPTRFIEMDLEYLSPDHPYDLVSLVGVLQQCGCGPKRAIAPCVRALRDAGLIFLTTKHIGWESFTSGRAVPEPSHSWFNFGEIRDTLGALGVEIIESGGFLPRENRVVPIERSHTFYILGRKTLGPDPGK
jgi:SAM-dependent methyltransferase